MLSKFIRHPRRTEETPPSVQWYLAQVKDILVDTNILIENVIVVIYSSQEKNSHQRNPFLEEDAHSPAVCKVLRFAVILTSLAFMTLGN